LELTGEKVWKTNKKGKPQRPVRLRETRNEKGSNPSKKTWNDPEMRKEKLRKKVKRRFRKKRGLTEKRKIEGERPEKLFKTAAEEKKKKKNPKLKRPQI